MHRTALHGRLRPPGTIGIHVAAEVTVVLRVGVDQHGGGPALLGQVNLDAAKVGAVAAEHDFAVQVDMLGGQQLEVLTPAVVGINHLAGDVARAGGAVEGHHHVGIVLVGVALNMFARRAGHQPFAGFVKGLHAHHLGLVQQHPVAHNGGFQAGLAEFLRHKFGGFQVLRRRRQVGLGGQCLQVLTGQLGAGHGQKLLLDAGLLGEVGIAEDRCRRLGHRLSCKRDGNQRQKNKGQRLARDHGQDPFRRNSNEIRCHANSERCRHGSAVKPKLTLESRGNQF